MPRVNRVKKSMKPQGRCGKCGDELPKGSPYVWWAFRYGGKRVRCTKPACAPRASDLTQAIYGQALAGIEGAHDDLAQCSDYEEAVSILESAAEEIRGAAEQYREAADAMGEAGYQFEEWADQLEGAADDLENANLSEPDEGDEDEDWREEASNALMEAEGEVYVG